MPAAGTPGAALRRAMARWATGVAVVTSRLDDRDYGLTVNALLSVALDPPRLLVSLTDAADTTPAIRASGRFAASFLAADQRALSERFAEARPPAEKFDGVPVHRGATGAALLDGALAWVECRVVDATPVADHVLFLGDVVATREGTDGLPLLFYHRGYGAVDAAGAVRLPPPDATPR